jgi:neutral ceramidase
MLKAGTAQVNITPPLGTDLVGQWVARKSVGVNDELFANALVLDDEKTRIAFVSCDVLSSLYEILSAKRQTLILLMCLCSELIRIPDQP